MDREYKMGKLDFQFWTGYMEGKDCFQWASEKAYRDMCRTIKFYEKKDNKSSEEKNDIDSARKEWRKRITAIIREMFKKLNNEEYNEKYDIWHDDVIKEIQKLTGKNCQVEFDMQNGGKGVKRILDCELTIGQIQKWLNMTIKYLWLLWRLNFLSAYDNVFEKHKKYFHVPLDSYILKYAAKESKGGNNIEDNGLLKKLEFTQDGKRLFEWSKINNFVDYKKFQTAFRLNISNQLIPLEWELEHWQKAIDFYGK